MFLLAFLSSQLHAEIYKCVDEHGKSTFTERPCGDSAEVVTVNPIKPPDTPRKSVSEYSDTLEAIGTRTDIKRLERKIDQLQSKKRSLQRNMDAEMARLKRKKMHANNNLAGATWEESISSEMQSVAESYKTKIQSAQNQINDTRRELSDLKSKPR
jgi:predicted RNase H-like nuclease (RuvC/YqgF family)